MAYIIKSNQVVNDPNNQFDYVTERGLASRDLAIYFNEVKANGYTLTQTEFDALKAYEEGLKTLGVWDNFIEFMPMFGDNLNAQLVKMKYEVTQSGVAINDFNNDNVDNGKGLIWNEHTRLGSKCVDLGLNQNDIYNKEGLGLLIYSNANTPGSHSNMAFYGSSASDSVMSLVINPLDGYRIRNIKLQASQFYIDDFSGDYTLFSKNKWSNDEITLRNLYKDGVIVGESTSQVSISLGTGANTNFYLGAINIVTDTDYSFYGGMRLFALHDSQILDTNITNIQALTDAFIVSSGKSFS